MHLFFFSFQRTLLSYLSASLTFKDTTKYDIFLYRTNVFTAFLLSFVLKFFTHH